MGFTDKMVKELLVPPVLKKNPVYSSGAPMKLWERKYVETVMSTAEYKAAKAVADGCRASARKAVETKEQKSRQILSEDVAHICVERIDIAQLMSDVLAAKSEWYEMQDEIRGEYTHFSDSVCAADDATKARWYVNYIRHNLTQYDEALWDFRGKVGRNAMYCEYRKAVFEKIKEVYLEFEDECIRQMECTL